MDLKTWQQLIVVVGAILPGFVFQVTRGWLQGSSESDKPVASRILTLLTLTIFFDSCYAWIPGPAIRSTLSARINTLEFARSTSVLVVLLVIVIPAAAAFAWSYFRLVIQHRKVRISLREVMRGSLFLTSWDYAAHYAFANRFIRIQFKDGRYIGGYTQGPHGHISTSPASKDLFISNLRIVDSEGYFAPRDESIKKYPYGGSGVWINCEEAISVEFLANEIIRPSLEKGESE